MFDDDNIDSVHPIECTCHSGGASGADTIWENEIINLGGKVRSYSYKTKYHNSPNKIEISDEDYEEGIIEIKKANKYLKRQGISKYMHLLSRNWCQVKYSNQTIAIGYLVKSGEKNKKGHISKSVYTSVGGGTGYAVMMSILHNHPTFVFDQYQLKWFRWSYQISDFIEMNSEDVYIQNKNFTGIGSRDINDDGINEIKNVLKRSIYGR